MAKRRTHVVEVKLVTPAGRLWQEWSRRPPDPPLSDWEWFALVDAIADRMKRMAREACYKPDITSTEAK
jgi:hypothetical protein